MVTNIILLNVLLHVQVVDDYVSSNLFPPSLLPPAQP